MIKVEEKLFQNRYKVDAGRAHIEIVHADVCQLKCELKPCTFCCPASCYTKEGDGRVTLITDGCLECGTWGSVDEVAVLSAVRAGARASPRIVPADARPLCGNQPDSHQSGDGPAGPMP